MKQKYFEKRDRKQKQCLPSPIQEEERSQNQLNQQVLQRFQSFMSNQRFKKLKSAMDNYIGRNSPINYHAEFGFQEQWEKKRSSNPKTFRDFLHSHNIYLEGVALFLLMGYCVLVWFVSFEVVFRIQGEKEMVFFDCLGLLVVLLHAGLKIVFHFREFYGEYSNIDYIKTFYIDVLMFVYFIFRLSVVDKEWGKSYWTWGVDAFFVAHGYWRGAQIYKSFRMKIITSIYKDVFNLFDLLATSLIVAHVFVIFYLIKALMLYLAGTSNFSVKSWIKIAQIDDEGPYTLYLYSLYFACTTMLTVGYGDLTPSNVLEIVTVLMIEIFGIAIFAYVINEIGHTLSSIRKQQQTLEKDLSTLSKVSKYYGLDQQLQTKARGFIIDNKTSINDLLPNEQKEFLMKLNDQLRTEINQQNSLKIIKSSVFFICHWSKKMQFETAKKLTKKLYSPNEKLFQNPGRETIYVIKKGKVAISTDRNSGLKRHFKKLLKTIEVQDEDSVAHNVYGYTAVISSRPIKLNAITKDFTVVYYLEKNDFIESIMDNELDFQYYHQIKCRIDMQKLPQAYQAPAILNIRQHYRPNVVFVIKKSKKRAQRNKRVEGVRDQARGRKRRMKVVIYDSIQQLQGDIDYPSKLFSSSAQHMIRTRTATNQKAVNYFTEQYENKKNLHCEFDCFREYQNYFKRFNLGNVLKQQETQNFVYDAGKEVIETLKSLRTVKAVKAKRRGGKYRVEDNL